MCFLASRPHRAVLTANAARSLPNCRPIAISPRQRAFTIGITDAGGRHLRSTTSAFDATRPRWDHPCFLLLTRERRRPRKRCPDAWIWTTSMSASASASGCGSARASTSRATRSRLPCAVTLRLLRRAPPCARAVPGLRCSRQGSGGCASRTQGWARARASPRRGAASPISARSPGVLTSSTSKRADPISSETGCARSVS